jgi:plastocyanin
MKSSRPTFPRPWVCAAKPARRAFSAALHGVFAVTLVTAFSLTGCGSSKTGDNAGTAPRTYGLPGGVLATLDAVTTSLAPSKVRAGETITVSCFGQPGDVAIPHPEYNIEGAEGAKKAGVKLVIEKTGLYKVHCTLHDGNTADATGAEVQVVPADAVVTNTALNPAKIAAGEQSKVTCSGKDKFNNAIGPADGTWGFEIKPSDLAAAKDAAVEGRLAGKGTVTCNLKDTTAAEVNGAALEVVPGKAAKTIATVKPAEIKAGDSAEVTCVVEDAHGNALPGDTATLDLPADLKLAGTKVTTELKGDYEIKCKHPSGDLEEVPAKLKVLAADPVDWKLVSKVNKDVWAIEETIVLRGRGKDKFGNETNFLGVVMPPKITGDATGLEQNPPAPATPKSYSYKTDGKYTFTTTLIDFAALGERSLDVLCDSEGPKVLISSPERAATLKGNKKVTVKGMLVDDWSGVKSFTVSGKDIPVEKDGSFSFELDSEPGMNTLAWKALDKWDRESHGVQAYYFSNKWYPIDAKQPEMSHIDNGIGVWLGQQVVDNGKHDHKNPKDLATVAEIVMGTLDWDALLKVAEQTFNQKVALTTIAGKAYVKNVKMGDKAKNNGYPEISITVIKGGMNLVAKIHNFSADLVLEGTMSTPPLPKIPFSQTVTVSAKAIEIQMDMLLTLDKKTGKIKSEAKNVDVNFVSLDINVKGLLGILSNWLLKAGGPLIEAAIEQVLKSSVNALLGSQIGTALEQLAINQELSLPPFIGDGPPAKLILNSKIGDLKFFPSGAQAGGMIVGLKASMTAEKKVKRDVLGSWGRDGCLDPELLKKQVFNPGQKFPLELAMADDFINQLLFSLWYGGGLSLEIDEKLIGGNVDLSSFGVSNLTVTTDFWLPPILNTCVDPKNVKIQIGDLKMNAKMNLSETPVDIDLFITTQATAELKAVKNPKTGETEIGIALKEIDFLELEVININAEAKNLEDLFVKLIKTVMMPKLIDSLGSGLGSFPLPAFDLSGFSPQIPKGTSLALAIQKIENKNGYTYLNGYLK